MNKLVAFTAAILMATSAQASTFDGYGSDSRREFKLMIKSAKILHNGLSDYGLESMADQWTNDWITNGVFGWDFEKGEKSASQTADNHNIYYNGSLDNLNNRGLKKVHQAGWIGEGVNIAIFDTNGSHGDKVEAIANNYAPGAQTGRYNKSAGQLFSSPFDLSDADIVTHSYGYHKNSSTNNIAAIMNNKVSMTPNALQVKGVANIGSGSYKGYHHHTAVQRNPVAKAFKQGKLDGEWIFVGNVNTMRQQHSVKAGEIKDHFIVDNGFQLGHPSFTSGTSFAVPRVAGAAALIKQKYPNLNNRQIKKLILYTAEDIGAPGVDEVFGHGLLDVKKAMSPFGGLN